MEQQQLLLVGTRGSNPVPNIPAIVWWILGLWFGLALLVAGAASRWFRYLRESAEEEYNNGRKEESNENSQH